jgi:hypothetical protein
MDGGRGVPSSSVRWASRKRGAGWGDWRGGGAAGRTGYKVAASLSHEDGGRPAAGGTGAELVR